MKERRGGRLSALAVALGLLGLATAAGAQTPDAAFEDLAVLLPAINDTLETAPSGEPVPWSNPATGNKGIIEVVRTFYRSDEAPCREYKRTTERPDDSLQLVYGTGCRTAPGFWRLDEGEARDVTPPGEAEEAKAETAPEPDEPKEIVREPDLGADEGTAAPAEPRAPIAVAAIPEHKPVLIVARVPVSAAE